MEQNGERRSIGCKHDQLADTAVEGLGGLVGTLLDLAIVGGLLDEIEDLLGQLLISLGPVDQSVLSSINLLRQSLTMRRNCRQPFRGCVGFGGMWWVDRFTALARLLRFTASARL